jgi:hypothetical protein
MAAWILVLLAAGRASGQVDLSEFRGSDPIVISAETAQQWQQGGYEVWVLRGNCRIRQGGNSARGEEAVAWIQRADAVPRRPSKVIAYLEGDVQVQQDPKRGKAKLIDRSWLGRFYTSGTVQIDVARVAGRPEVVPAIYQRGWERLDPGPPGAVSSSFLGRSVIRQSLMISTVATLNPFCRAHRTTFAGSTMPAATRSQ